MCGIQASRVLRGWLFTHFSTTKAITWPLVSIHEFENHCSHQQPNMYDRHFSEKPDRKQLECQLCLFMPTLNSDSYFLCGHCVSYRLPFSPSLSSFLHSLPPSHLPPLPPSLTPFSSPNQMYCLTSQDYLPAVLLVALSLCQHNSTTRQVTQSQEENIGTN